MEYEGLEALDQMQKEKVQTFMAVTGVDNINLAMQFLQSCDFNLEHSVETFFATGGNISPDQSNPQPPVTNEHQHYEEYHEQEFNNFGFQEPHQFEDHQFDQGHGLPEYTEEENEYYRYMLNKSEKGGIVGGIINAVSGIRSWVPFSSTSGEEFIKQLAKFTGKSKISINFQKLNLESTLESMEQDDKMPLLLYIHDNAHPLVKEIIKDVLQSPTIAPLIVATYRMLSSNKEFMIASNLIDGESYPCFMVLRKNRVGKIARVALIDLTNKGFLEKEVVVALLREALDNFHAQQRMDTEFIAAFNEKVRRRRQVSSSHISSILAQHEAPPQAPRQVPVQAPSAEDHQLLADRRLRKEQEEQYAQMQDAARLKKEKELAIQQQKLEEEKLRLLEEEAQKKILEQQAKAKDRQIQQRKKDLGQEPPEGDAVVKIAVRLPTGQRIIRRFNNFDTVQALYDFVWAQDEIGLENKHSDIELMYSYPPKPLLDKKIALKEVFGESAQELLNIHEIEP